MVLLSLLVPNLVYNVRFGDLSVRVWSVCGKLFRSAEAQMALLATYFLQPISLRSLDIFILIGSIDLNLKK
jgi:hypothetical protein